MPQALGIKEIKSKLLSPALTSLYYVRIGLPSSGPLSVEYMKNSGVRLDQDRLNLMCCEATLPGSRLATLEQTNDRTGVTERHAHRRQFDDRIDLTFYVNAENYMPIRFFETWMNFISQQSTVKEDGKPSATDKDYFYRMEYPDDYMSDNGMVITKFEKSSFGNSGFVGFLGGRPTKGGELNYTFIRTFPVSITSMPITYEASNLLKCTVGMSYIRYVVDGANPPIRNGGNNSNRGSGLYEYPGNLDLNFRTGLNTDLGLTPDLLSNLDTSNAFTAQGQASTNFLINPGVNFGGTPVSEQISPGQQ